MTEVESAGPSAGAGLRPAFAATRTQLGLVLALVGLAAVGWWWTAEQMRGMDDGPWTALGTLGWFLTVWVVMMAAMMFPSVAPTIALYARMNTQSRLAPVAFTAGYLITWTGAGVVAFLIGLVATRALGDHLAWENAGRSVAGATLILAAVYELTPLKNACLGKCRSPLGLPPRVLARRVVGGPRHGGEERCLVRRLLLGADGFALRIGRQESPRRRDLEVTRRIVCGGTRIGDRERDDRPGWRQERRPMSMALVRDVLILHLEAFPASGSVERIGCTQPTQLAAVALTG